MNWISRGRGPRTLQWQLVIVASVSLLAAVVCSGLLLMLWVRCCSSRPDAWLSDQSADAGRSIDAGRTAELLTLAEDHGFEIRHVVLEGNGQYPAQQIAEQLSGGWQVEIVEPQSLVALPLAAHSVFVAESHEASHRSLQALALLVVVTWCTTVLMLSIYVRRMLSEPLALIGLKGAAHARGPMQLDERTPAEVVRIAQVVNDLYAQLPSIDRVHMLAAMSHDLRMPLTRLRLRAERAEEETVRAGLLRDIDSMARMLEQTVRHATQAQEAFVATDLSSLLQTVCHEFADVGHAVSFKGPARLVWHCRPDSLGRAIANLVDNAIAHAERVSVALRPVSGDQLEIDVIDDGSGIPVAMRDRVLEPRVRLEWKSESVPRPGFGLGLAIARDIVIDHGGSIVLLDAQPQGLIVRVTLSRPSVKV